LEHNPAETKNGASRVRDHDSRKLLLDAVHEPDFNFFGYDRTLEMKQKFNIPGPSALMQIPGFPVSRP
jgi:hypothetical protein